MNLDRIALFLHVARLKNFSAAARELGLSTAAVSKQVQLLEEDLGIKLLHRTTRLVTLTEAGHGFFLRANAAVHELSEAIQQAGEKQNLPRGTLRVSMPVTFGHTYMLGLLNSFAEKYPDIILESTFDDRMVDPVAEGYDVVIRIGPMHDSSLMMKPLGLSPLLLVASPTYLKSAPALKTPNDLKNHRIIGYMGHGAAFEWTYQGPKNQNGHLRTDCTMRTNSAEMMLAAARAGNGITLLPKLLACIGLDAGDLVQVLPGYVTTPLRQIVALTAPSRQRTAKVQAFLGHLNDLPKFA